MFSPILNPFLYQPEYDINILYPLIREYLQKWSKLIYRERKVDYRVVEPLVIDAVSKNFTGNFDTLEAYVKATAMQVRIGMHPKHVSMYRPISEEDEDISLIDTLSEDDRLSVGSYSLTENKKRVKRVEYVWNDWLDELREVDIDDLKFSDFDITSIMVCTPILETALMYAQEEVLYYLNDGVSSKSLQKDFFKSIAQKLANVISTNDTISPLQIRKMLAIYLQYREVFQRHYSLLLLSDIPNKLDSNRSSTVFGFVDGFIQKIRATPHSLFFLDVDTIIDSIYDDYFSEVEQNNFKITIGGRTFYNVLSGVYVEDGDFSKILVNHFVDLIRNKKGCDIVLRTEKGIYVSIIYSSEELTLPFYYFGKSIVLNLTKVRVPLLLKGEGVYK